MTGIEKYLLNKSRSRSNPIAIKLKAITLVGLYLFLSIVLVINQNMQLQGIFSQLQVMIAIYLVISNIKKGYVIAVLLVLLTLIMAAIALFVKGNLAALSGIIVTSCTLIICRIIYVYHRQLMLELEEAKLQNEKINILYEEISITEEELRRQNLKLMEYVKKQRASNLI
ncbi:MAG: hypothetical protein WBI07_17190 [Mobilitalea sp.]